VRVALPSPPPSLATRKQTLGSLCVLCVALLPAAAETQDAELAQACLLVTLVVLAKGTVQLPAEPLRDQAAFKESMKSVSMANGRGLGRMRGHAHGQ
jgi:hypothetical protein